MDLNRYKQISPPQYRWHLSSHLDADAHLRLLAAKGYQTSAVILVPNVQGQRQWKQLYRYTKLTVFALTSVKNDSWKLKDYCIFFLGWQLFRGYVYVTWLGVLIQLHQTWLQELNSNSLWTTTFYQKTQQSQTYVFSSQLLLRFLFKKMTKTFIQVCWWILPVPCPRASPKKLLVPCHPMPGGWRWVGDDHGDGDAKAYMVCWNNTFITQRPRFNHEFCKTSCSFHQHVHFTHTYHKIYLRRPWDPHVQSLPTQETVPHINS